MGVLHVDKVVRLGEIPERGSVDRPEGEPRGTPTLRGEESRRKAKGTAGAPLEEKEEKQETMVSRQPIVKSSLREVSRALK